MPFRESENELVDTFSTVVDKEGSLCFSLISKCWLVT